MMCYYVLIQTMLTKPPYCPRLDGACLTFFNRHMKMRCIPIMHDMKREYDFVYTLYFIHRLLLPSFHKAPNLLPLGVDH